MSDRIADRDEVVRRLRADRWSYPRIAACLGVSRFAVYKSAARLGLDRRRVTKITADIREQVGRLRGLGLAVARIAGRLGLKGDTVRYLLHRLRVRKNRSAPDARGLARLRELHAAGASPPEIARELGIDRTSAHHWLRRLGLESGIRQAQRRWPAVKSVAQARVLDALVGGPKTAPELSRETGYRYTPCVGGGLGGSIHKLRGLGLVVTAGRRPDGPGRPFAVYALAPGLRPAGESEGQHGGEADKANT